MSERVTEDDMFQQTFLDESQPSHKPYTMFLSVVLQSTGVGLLALLPLIYTQVLPSAQLKSELVAPPRPPVTSIPFLTKRTVIPTHRMFDSHLLFAPAVIPHQSNQVNETIAAPAIGITAAEGATASFPDGVPGGLFGSAAAAPPQFAPIAKPERPKGPVRVGTIQESDLIHKVVPVYPSAAKAAHVQGAVEFTAIISKQGTIENLQLVRGNPLLVNAAKEAVLQWRYRPTLLNGERVEVITNIVVNFVLGE